MAAKHEKDHGDWISKAQLKQLGFTDTMIRDLMGEPERRAQNPYSRNAAPMSLWRPETVMRVMDSDEFKARLAKAKARRESAAKAAQTKRDALMDDISRASAALSVEHVGKSKLRREALDSRAAWYMDHGDFDGAADIASGDVDAATVERFEVNYLRHERTDYDAALEILHGRVGARDAYELLHDAVLDLIASEYPYLSGECERQKQTKHSYAEQSRAYSEQCEQWSRQRLDEVMARHAK